MDDDRDRGYGGGRTGGDRGGNNGGNNNTSTKASTPEPTTTAKNDPPPATTTNVAPTQAAPTTDPPGTKPATTQAPVVNPTSTEAQKPAETQKQDVGGNNSTVSPAAPTPTQRTAPGSGDGSGQEGTAGGSNGNSGSTPAVGGGNRNGASSSNGGVNSGTESGSSEGGKGSGSSVAGGAVVGGNGATGTNGIGSGSGSNSSGASGASNGGSSSKGSSGGVIAGVVIGILAILALVALLLFLLRKKPKVQRFLARFRKGGGRSRSSYPIYGNGPDGMGNNLLDSRSGLQGGMLAAGFAAAPVMRQNSRSARPPLLPLSANSNRVSSPTGESLSSRAFTTSPTSPLSPASILSPPAHGGAPVAYPGRPQYVPPSPTIPRPTKPRVMHVANLSSGGPAAPSPVAGYRQPKQPPNPQPQAQHNQQQLQPQHARGGSVSSVSTTSALSAIINPQMVWPMPPATPTLTGRLGNSQQHHRGGSVPQNGGRGPERQPHLVDFEHSGLTVVKISRPLTGGRRPGTGRMYQ